MRAYALHAGTPRGASMNILRGPRKNTQVKKVTVTDTAAINLTRYKGFGIAFDP